MPKHMPKTVEFNPTVVRRPRRRRDFFVCRTCGTAVQFCGLGVPPRDWPQDDRCNPCSSGRDETHDDS